MSRRHADNWSHPGHYLVDPCTWPWSSNGHGHGHEWPTATPFVQCQSAHPFWDTAISKFYHENPWSKIMCVVKGQGHVWPSKFKGQGHDQGQTRWSHLRPWRSLNMFAFSFRGNRTIFGWDITNSIYDLENSRSRSWPRSNPMVTFEP